MVVFVLLIISAQALNLGIWLALRHSCPTWGSPGPGRFPYSHSSWVSLRPSVSDFGQGPGRFPYSHSSWLPLRPSHASDSDFSQNWSPGHGEITLLSLWLGAIYAQWFRLQPELEAQDRGNYPTLTAVMGAIEAQWFRLRPELEAQDQGDSPTLFEWSQGCFFKMQSTHHSAFDKPVELHWWTCVDKLIGYLNPVSFDPGPNQGSTTWPHISTLGMWFSSRLCGVSTGIVICCFSLWDRTINNKSWSDWKLLIPILSSCVTIHSFADKVSVRTHSFYCVHWLIDAAELWRFNFLEGCGANYLSLSPLIW
jgi:hypothetical protein